MKCQVCCFNWQECEKLSGAGDEVIAFTLFNGYAEFAVADERAVVKKPAYLSFADAASIPVNFATAYHSLFETGTLRPGAKVLIHAGAGGVGLAAIQMAKTGAAPSLLRPARKRRLNCCKNLR
jgi:NADPH:quinone reductase-like Zn-dependent oxidoreductase